MLVACSGAQTPQWFEAENPKLLSQWQVLNEQGNQFQLSENTRSYNLSSGLFTDYASKYRTISLPEGKSAILLANGDIEFPNQTIISKTFYYPSQQPKNLEQRVADLDSPKLSDSRLMETRLLVKRQAGWQALPYVWNDNKSAAKLKRVGAILNASIAQSDGDFNYVVPNVNQCAGCHQLDLASDDILPIGPRFKNLPIELIEQWLNEGWLVMAEGAIIETMQKSLVTNVDWQDRNYSIDRRARAYLDINCGHCHSPTGPGDTSGLFLTAETNEAVRLGVCKPPIAAGQGTGGNKYSIVPSQPNHSILLYRMQSTDPGAMMPELSRSLVHTEGVELIRQWIKQMQGNCS